MFNRKYLSVDLNKLWEILIVVELWLIPLTKGINNTFLTYSKSCSSLTLKGSTITIFSGKTNPRGLSFVFSGLIAKQILFFTIAIDTWPGKALFFELPESSTIPAFIKSEKLFLISSSAVILLLLANSWKYDNL